MANTNLARATSGENSGSRDRVESGMFPETRYPAGKGGSPFGNRSLEPVEVESGDQCPDLELQENRGLPEHAG